MGGEEMLTQSDHEAGAGFKVEREFYREFWNLTNLKKCRI